MSYSHRLEGSETALVPLITLPRRSRICLGVMAALGYIPAALAGPSPSPSPAVPSPSPSPQEVQFSASFLGSQAGNYDLASYERGNPVLPGTYAVDLFLNGFEVGRENVEFRTPAAGGPAQACITREMLILLGVNVAKLESEGTVLSDCVDVPAAVANATVTYDSGALRLDISIPQVALSRSPRGYVDPKLWDEGINAFTLGYNFNVSNTQFVSRGNGASAQSDSRSAYLGLNAGLNIGGWRIRNQSNYTWSKNSGREFRSIQTYAQHDITALKSQLTLGETFTNGQLFDSTAFRGIQLASDSRMRPDTMNGFAPTVRGTAETNATVTVYQHGYVIYEASVAPGDFEINDLYPNGAGGDLEVVITEADGRARSFKVPYSSVPNLLRPGISNYSATLGEVRNVKNKAPRFFEGTYQRGINNWLTTYVGAQATQGDLYRSALVGAAVNTPVGAISVDVSKARTKTIGDPSRSGYSARITYNKNIPATNTEFALAAYRYASEGYRSLNEAVTRNDFIQTYGPQPDLFQRQRSRFQFTVSQRLGERAGSLYVSGSRSDFWDRMMPVDYSYQMGWNNRYRDLGYSVSAMRTRVTNGQYDNSYYLNFSLPLGRATQRGVPPALSVGLSNTRTGSSATASVTGVAGDERQFNYGAHATLNNTRLGSGESRNSSSVAINAGWRAAYGTMSGSYTHARDSRNLSLSGSGGVVIHGGGVTLANQLGETIGLVRAQGAKGARLTSDPVGRVDGRGYMVTNNLMPYRMNEVSLDPKGTSLDVELETSRLRVAPRAGAVVALDYGTKTGKAMLLRAALENGQAVPFGARVMSSTGQEIGLVGQGGQVFVRDLAENSGEWTVDWGDGQGCVLEKPALSAAPPSSDLEIVRAMCRSH